MNEKKIQNQIWKIIGALKNVRLFRNNVGTGFQGVLVFQDANKIILENYRRIKFGLMEGSADLIGWKSVEITPDMVGKKVAVFVSIENKTKTGRIKESQLNWEKQIKNAGGLAGIARNVDEAKFITGEK